MPREQNSSTAAVRSVLVVDDDELARNLIANHLGRMGMGTVDLVEDGDAAWQKIQEKSRENSQESSRENSYDLIILDWKLPGLSGLALFNRIRQHPGYRVTPLLVVSGLLEKQDFRLLAEFPCTGLMEKPFTKVLFENRVADLLREVEWYGQNAALVDGLLEAVDGNAAKIEQLVKQILKKAPNPVPLALVAARRLVKCRMLKPAEAVLESVLKFDENCVVALNELGKIRHFQGRHRDALGVLQAASKLSPQNVQRLCLIGEVELNLDDPAGAQASFAKAMVIDDETEIARAGAVIAGNMRALGFPPPAPDGVPRTFASVLNTLGIALVRNREYARGLEQYRAAMVFLPRRGDAARVAFNLGLGYLRWGRPEEALPWFQKSTALLPEGFGRSSRYVSKLLAEGGSLDEAAINEESIAPKRLPEDGRLADAGSLEAADEGTAGAAGEPSTAPHTSDNLIPFPIATDKQVTPEEAPSAEATQPTKEDKESPAA